MVDSFVEYISLSVEYCLEKYVLERYLDTVALQREPSLSDLCCCYIEGVCSVYELDGKKKRAGTYKTEQTLYYSRVGLVVLSELLSFVKIKIL